MARKARKNIRIGDIAGRHGDVGLVLAELPDGAVEQPRNGDVILAFGEATGHAHRIVDDQASIWVIGNEKYLVTKAPCVLDHEEHGKVTVPPGIFRIAIEEDYSPGEVYVPVVD